ncbi:MAG: hypothetical protein MZU84_04525 [Sphingobacterium sp.]|nr:hypothetical protein [Sphingobacterium sp.]
MTMSKAAEGNGTAAALACASRVRPRTPGELQARPRQVESARLAVPLEQQAQVRAGAASAVEQAQIAAARGRAGRASATRTGGTRGTRSDPARRARWLRAVDPQPYSILLASTPAACHNNCVTVVLRMLSFAASGQAPPKKEIRR